ncbi:hypothetical protein H5410_034864 [Solanum commersonii]|uniref:Uncharacterized protein n=1 Tax=Solanum commersonii TaxID=4109 RepID=A0A9J5Y263_SOLCO|nr:hypothetical protein H5410_034864 [Solanum commersonii]
MLDGGAFSASHEGQYAPLMPESGGAGPGAGAGVSGYGTEAGTGGIDSGAGAGGIIGGLEIGNKGLDGEGGLK